ncbi:1-aminocyclopropane-1-carboxylate oxidase [Citrus sinensis]|uniref:Fe2OG dioxygenase domain-containing protein n=2 Tax=Citrus TaxID=2706 RepID=V4RJC5_CITCL|nr:hypothetical protein CICLE_v10005201mg [Citrus x clementina]KAH9649884.1 1-aminocyclopropane-1-carboxylate oxidase [Citrus sinensis]GAY63014.1 hypothetical protein CUMW_222190 [Citrus unshiu]
MITADAGYSNAHCAPKYDRKSELKAFDDTKAGVKGLVDAGITKIPRIFIHDQLKLSNSRSGDSEFIIPILDLDGVNKDAISRAKIVKQVQNACQNWGFFQIVNHGIPVSMLDEMIDGVIGFHEQDTEVKKKFYTRDYQKRKVLYNTNFDFYAAPAANWRDTLSCVMAPNPPDPEELPEVCRDIIVDYAKKTTELALTLFELISEALGLNANRLKDMDCAEGLFLLGHYYPTCPEPELTMGTDSHADSSFLTVLLQDRLGGLQVLHENEWVNVTPIYGALVVNLGDMMQAS